MSILKNPSNFLFSILVIFILGITFSCEKDCECDEYVTEEFQVDLSEFEIIRVKQNSVTCGLEIDDEELDSVIEMGIIFSQSMDPTLDLNEEGKLVIDPVVEDFIGSVDGLNHGTTYNIRAYVISSADTSYSEQLSFTTIEQDGTKGTVTDIDGNTYETMIIGGLEWMVENLRVTHYRDGTEIITGVSDEEYGTIDYGAYGIYQHRKLDGFESDADVALVYGALYNWYAVGNERGLSPEGWHIPTDEDWMELERHLGMSESQVLDTDYRGVDQGIQMKSLETVPDPNPSWERDNVSTNSSGFNAIPGGGRYESGNFGYKGWFAYFWTSSEVGTSDAWARILVYYEDGVGRNIVDKNMGYSIRCVKD